MSKLLRVYAYMAIFKCFLHALIDLEMVDCGDLGNSLLSNDIQEAGTNQINLYKMAWLE